MYLNLGNIIKEQRLKRNMTQETLASALGVTSQAVSRWENGETTPNTETLKLLSKLFDVSINTLLGSPRQLICQCCGMPWRILPLVKKQMVFLMKNTASGAMSMESLHIVAWMI